MNATSDELNATRVRPASGATASADVTRPATPSASAAFDEAVRAILHRRLKLGAVIGLVIALPSILIWFAAGRGDAAGGASGLWSDLTIVAVAAAALLALRGRPQLARLRVVELGVFGGLSLVFGVFRFVGCMRLPPPSPDPEHSKVVVEYVTLLDNLPVYFTLFIYGLMVPTGRRRGALMVAAMGAIPLVSIAAAGVANPALRPQLPFLLAATTVGVTAAGAAALYGATRINTLQRQAFDAERRADEMGQYTLKKKLGEGGMGEVWLAEHRLLKRPCAVKFVRADLAANPATATRFAREVQAVTALTHFNTVRIYDYGRSDDGSFYYVMEYLDGPTLDALVKSGGPLSPGRAVYLLRQLCGALAEAHGAGMVHRDLKPGNILVAALGGQRDVAKLLDFGLVQDLSTEGGVRLTQTGVVMGTPTYMCPEQAAGEAVDARGDLYSLGAVAFFMLAGRPPFDGTSLGQLIAAHLTQPAPDVRELRPAVPADLAAVVAKCLAKEPKARYQTAVELDAALAACSCSADWTPIEAERWWEQGAPADRPTVTAHNRGAP